MFEFAGLKFIINDGCIYLQDFCNFKGAAKAPFVEVQICGENKDTHLGAKMVNSSEGKRLQYVSHKQVDNRLEIVQRSPLIEAKTTFISYMGTSSLRICTEIKNISSKKIVL